MLPPPFSPVTDSPDGAPSPLCADILFNLAYNILIILMLKFGSSNILWLCLTIQVPVRSPSSAAAGCCGGFAARGP